MISVLSKRRSATLAGIFSLALGSLVLLCGAGSAPIENFLPQGAMQGDLNVGGHNLTNAATVYATNVVVSGSLTAPSSFTVPYGQVTGTPTTLSGYGITDPVVLTSGSYANPAWLTSLAYTKLSGAPTLATVAMSGSYNDLSSKPTIPSAPVNSDWNATSGLSQILNKPALAPSATTDTTSASNISSGTLASARGGAGTVNGILKANGSGTVAQAISGTDYAPATTGSSILAGNGSGGTAAATTAQAAALLSGGSGTLTLGNYTLGLALSQMPNGVAEKSAANTFTATQTFPNYLMPTGPTGINNVYLGDSRLSSASGSQVTAGTENQNPWGYLDRLVYMEQYMGFGWNAYVTSAGESSVGVENNLLSYACNSFTTTATITKGSNSVTVTGSTSGISGNFGIGGPGIPPGTYGTISGSTITLHNQYPITTGQYATALTPTISTTGATIDISPLSSTFLSWTYQTPHESSPAVSGCTGSVLVIETGANDYIPYSGGGGVTMTNGSNTFSYTGGAGTTWAPFAGCAISGVTGLATGTTISSVSYNYSTNTTTITMSNNYTGTTGTVVPAFTPNASSWETAMTTLINAATADNYKVVLVTIPKPYISTYSPYDSVRQTMNAWELSTYGTTALGNDAYSGSTSGVYVIDSATASNNYFQCQVSSLMSSDGLHFTPQGEALWANEINTALETIFASSMTGNPVCLNAAWNTPATNLGLVYNLTIGSSTQPGTLTISGGTGNPTINFASSNLQLNAGNWNFNYGSNQARIPGGVTGTIPVIPSAAPTSVAGSTSGTAAFSEPFNQTYYKKVLVYCSALNGTASFTFPTAFSNPPVVLTTSGPAASAVTSLSATAMTVTGSSTTGPIVVEGY